MDNELLISNIVEELQSLGFKLENSRLESGAKVEEYVIEVNRYVYTFILWYSTFAYPNVLILKRNKVGEKAEHIGWKRPTNINQFLLDTAYGFMESSFGVYTSYSVPIVNFHSLFEWVLRIKSELEKAGFNADTNGTFLSEDSERLRIDLIIKSDSEIEGTIQLLSRNQSTYTCTQYLNKGPFLPALLTGLNHQLIRHLH